MKKHATAAAVSAAIAVALTGCAGGAGGYSAGSGGGSSRSASPSASAYSAAPYGRSTGAASGAASPAGTLHTVSTKLGGVLASGSSTLYVFMKDVPNSGRSACIGPCLTYWPPLLGPSLPKAAGVTGKLGTIPAAGGKKQLTIGGRPLYTFSGDSAAGDTRGQGVNGSGGLWWVVSPAGKPITTR